MSQPGTCRLRHWSASVSTGRLLPPGAAAGRPAEEMAPPLVRNCSDGKVEHLVEEHQPGLFSAAEYADAFTDAGSTSNTPPTSEPADGCSADNCPPRRNSPKVRPPSTRLLKLIAQGGRDARRDQSTIVADRAAVTAWHGAALR